jgi:hypothetical protein
MIRQSLMAVVGRLGPEVDGLGFFADLKPQKLMKSMLDIGN